MLDIKSSKYVAISTMQPTEAEILSPNQKPLCESELAQLNWLFCMTMQNTLLLNSSNNPLKFGQLWLKTLTLKRVACNFPQAKTKKRP